MGEVVVLDGVPVFLLQAAVLPEPVRVGSAQLVRDVLFVQHALELQHHLQSPVVVLRDVQNVLHLVGRLPLRALVCHTQGGGYAVGREEKIVAALVQFVVHIVREKIAAVDELVEPSEDHGIIVRVGIRVVVGRTVIHASHTQHYKGQ